MPGKEKIIKIFSSLDNVKNACVFFLTEQGLVYLLKNDEKQITKVKVLKNIVSISTFRQHLAMDNEGKVFAWGRGCNGELFCSSKILSVPRVVEKIPRAISIHAYWKCSVVKTIHGCYFSGDKKRFLTPKDAQTCFALEENPEILRTRPRRRY